MAMRKSGPLDAMVGAKVRMLRVNRGISQTALAERIGVTFQQVQKYEQGAEPGWRQLLGANRFRAGRFGWRAFRIFPGWTTRLEFAGSLAR